MSSQHHSAGHSQPTPAGFRWIDWCDATPNTLIYRAVNFTQPCRVIDVEARLVQKLVSDLSDVIDDERVLVKEGPVVVVSTLNGKFVGLYADVPLEVVVSDDTSKLRRPRPLDQLPGTVKASLLTNAPTDWDNVYGDWDVLRTTTSRSPTMSSFNIHDSVAASHVLLTFFRGKRVVTVAPATTIKSGWTFTTTRVDHEWIIAECAELLS